MNRKIEFIKNPKNSPKTDIYPGPLKTAQNQVFGKSEF